MVRSNIYLLIEFLLLCLALPTYIIVTKSAPFMFTFLWGAMAYCALIYRYRFFTTWRDLWKWDTVTWVNMKPILIRWVLACIGMTLFLYFYDASRMFYLVEHRPQFIMILFMLYPLLSALPQEFIFCSFFFNRYERYFKTGWPMIIASAVTFAYAHVLYINPVAPALSLIGGLIFAHTFYKHRSLALVTIEHGLYGNFLFLLGLGWYFYGGSVVQAAAITTGG